MVVSFWAVFLPGLHVLTETPLMTACWVTSWLLITSTLAPTLTLPPEAAACGYVMPLVAGKVAALGCRLSPASPDRPNGVDEVVALAGSTQAPKARIGIPLAAAITSRSLRTIGASSICDEPARLKRSAPGRIGSPALPVLTAPGWTPRSPAGDWRDWAPRCCGRPRVLVPP